MFSLARSIPLEQLQSGAAITIAATIDALEGYPVQPLDASEVGKIVRGIDVEARMPGERAALVDAAGSGALVAFAERRPSEHGDRWQPRVVMRETLVEPLK